MDVLFVCLGNICRSPMAEAVFISLVSSRTDTSTWLIDSAGTSNWHVGSQPHDGTQAVLARHGIPWSHQARQVERADFHRFDLLLAMDRGNLARLREMRPRHATAVMQLLGQYDPTGCAEVPDPYQTHTQDLRVFEDVYAQIERCCRGLSNTVIGAAPPGSPPGAGASS